MAIKRGYFSDNFPGSPVTEGFYLNANWQKSLQKQPCKSVGKKTAEALPLCTWAKCSDEIKNIYAISFFCNWGMILLLINGEICFAMKWHTAKRKSDITFQHVKSLIFDIEIWSLQSKISAKNRLSMRAVKSLEEADDHEGRHAIFAEKILSHTLTVTTVLKSAHTYESVIKEPLHWREAE